MNLNTIEEVKRPTSAGQIGQWRDGYAWLAGGTWLFSEPQLATRTLIDLDGLGWAPLTATTDGLEIAATCRVADMAGRSLVQPLHRRVPDVVQDLERSVDRRQRLHVAAGRRHDLAHRRARGCLHPVAA